VPSTSPQAQPNKEAQEQLIGSLTAAEAHALMLDRSLQESQASMIALGKEVFEGERALLRLDARLDEVHAKRLEAQNRLEADREALAGIVRRVYKHHNNFLLEILSAGGFAELLRAFGYSQTMVGKEERLIRSVQIDEAVLAHAQQDLEKNRAEKKEVVTRLQKSREVLATQIETQQRLQKQLQETIDAVLTALDAMKTDTPAAAAERERLVRVRTDSVLREIEQAIWGQANAASAIMKAPPSDPSLLGPGGLMWPIPHATISQVFGPSPFVFEPSYAGYPHFHTGVDLAVPLGTPVFAASDGVVVSAAPMTDKAGNLVGYGNYIILLHPAGLKTLYGHLLSTGVREGDLVKRGQFIGLVGSTGNSTGAHTHFEIRLDSTPIDPIPMLPPAQVVHGGGLGGALITPGE
jgi:murein DD-endopeptidase MepM/ murein hydrolase activator NlpD